MHKKKEIEKSLEDSSLRFTAKRINYKVANEYLKFEFSFSISKRSSNTTTFIGFSVCPYLFFSFGSVTNLV